MFSEVEVIWKPRNPHPKPAPTHVPRLIWEVLSARGFDEEEAIQKCLSPSLKHLRDPLTLKDMNAAVERLLAAMDRGERIAIYADYDLDGTSGLALMIKAFHLLGFKNFTYYQPSRLTEGYGLHKEAITRLKSDGATLLLTIDLGITAIEEVEHAKSLGMDVIITDHHLPKETLPAAVAVVNPNRGDCTAGLGHLCGTGVAFYLVLALRRALLEQGLSVAFDPKELLDCFVIGTLTDMVPLIDENRTLVKHGLVALAQTKRPGLRVLLQALNLWGNPLTSQDVAIRFAPKLNALSRMEMGLQPLDLYLVDDETKAHALVSQVLSNNQSRMAWQKSAEQEAKEFLLKQPPRSSIFVWSRNFHRGVVGLVATKLSQEYQLPAFVGACEEDGQIVGSARLPDGWSAHLLEAMEFARAHLTKFGGHAVAAGFELQEQNTEGFALALDEFFSRQSKSKEPRCWLYDAQATLADLSPSFMSWYEHLSPFGAHFAPPVFFLENAQISQVQRLKGGHLRLTFSDGAQVSRVAVWFSPPAQHSLLQGDALRAGSRVQALVEPQWNYFAGRKTLQLLIQDLKLVNEKA